MDNQKISITQIDGIKAKDLLTHIESLKNDIKELKDKVKTPEKIVLLTRQEVAQKLDISLVTLHKWTKKGLLISYRIGNQVRYKENEVLQALTIIENKKRV